MKKCILCIFIMTAIITGSLAQNFMSIDTANTRYFLAQWSSSSNVNAIRIDTLIPHASGMMYANFHTTRDTGGTCVNMKGPSWIGPGMFDRNDGYNIFFNQYNDSIKINPSASLLESWTMYKFDDGKYILATVTGIGYESFINLNDTVKTFSLQCKDIMNNDVSHSLNGFNFKLSQHYGLTQLLEFYFFPDASIPYEISAVHVPTIAEIRNWEVADEFHFSEYDRINSMPQHSKSIVMKVLAKNPGVSYTVSEEVWDTDWSWSGTPPVPSTTTTYTQQNIDYSIESSPEAFVYLPGEACYLYNWDAGISYSYNITMTSDSGTCWDKIHFSVSDASYRYDDQIDSCWKNIFEPCYSNQTYILGIGEIWSQGCPNNYQESARELVYFKKGDTVCGTPLSIGGSPEIAFNLTVSPNPYTSAITFELNEKLICNTLKVEYYDLYGRLLMSREGAHVSSITIDRQGLANGIYIYKLYRNGNLLTTGKFIAE